MNVGCWWKQGFEDRVMAVKVSKGIHYPNKRGKRPKPPKGMRMSVYKCGECSLWHVGSESK